MMNNITWLLAVTNPSLLAVKMFLSDFAYMIHDRYECLRLKNMAKQDIIDPEEKYWVAVLTECPFCHQKSQMFNKKENKYGCLNWHCQKYYEYL
jgi:hypothetical protein